MKAKEKPPKSDFKTSDFGGFCLMALTKSTAGRPVTSRGTRILRRGFPLALCGHRPCSGSLFPPQAAVACAAIPRTEAADMFHGLQKSPWPGRDPYGNLPRAALSRTAAPASCGAVSRLHSAAAGPAPAPCFRHWRRSPAQHFLVRKLRICSTACKKARGRGVTRTGISRGPPCHEPRLPHPAARFPACTLRPLALLRLPVSATGGGRLRSTSSYGSTKIVLQPELEDYFGDPYGNRTQSIIIY